MNNYSYGIQFFTVMSPALKGHYLQIIIINGPENEFLSISKSNC